LESRVVSVAMFKNGLALVEREVKPRAAGDYQITDIPQPVHGTLWFDGVPDLSARIVMRKVKRAPQPGEVDLQRDLVGRKVTVYLREINQSIRGTVRKYEEPDSSSTTPPIAHLFTSGVQSTKKYLVLDTTNGQSFIDESQIVHLSADTPTETVTRLQPVLLLNVPGKEGNAPKPVRIRYLAMGISWAPSYLVDLVDDKKLRLHQKAVIRNELSALGDTELQLISGFPHVQFRHVTSPFSPTTTWAQFFQQINSQPQGQSLYVGNSLSQQGLSSNFRGGALPMDLSATPSGEGVDLHYESIGRHSLGKNETLTVPVAAATADYDRIVEWIVPDSRDASGRVRNSRNQPPQQYAGDAWDALQFRNPLDMPMTTGAATIMSKGRFSGQTASYWVSRGEETRLRVTKALSIRTLASENEKQGERDLIYIGGNDFQRVSVEGQLVVSNHRGEVVDMVIRRQFSGALSKADGDPKKSLREEGVYSVNRRNELTWTLQLKPGAQQILKYEYTVLVDR